MAARMKDIAKALNLSIVTVSKVLNKKDPNISEATRKRVLECARKLDYRPNLAAKSLVTGQSRMIGMIVPELFHGFFGEVAAGMSDALTQRGYGLILASSRDQQDLEEREVRQMLARRVDALIVASCSSNPSFLESADREIPVILFDRRLGSRGSFWLVGADDLLAGELATQHLVDIGRTKIAFIGAASFSPTSDRREGYLSVLRRAKLKSSPRWVVRLPQNEESNPAYGGRAIRQLLETDPRPDAVFCYNDPTAWGATMAILEAGLRIPEDIAVVGCGNTSHDEFLRVPLTSVDLNAADLGREAATLALRAIGDRAAKKEPVPAAILLRPKLVVRESTAGRRRSIRKV